MDLLFAVVTTIAIVGPIITYFTMRNRMRKQMINDYNDLVKSEEKNVGLSLDNNALKADNARMTARLKSDWPYKFAMIRLLTKRFPVRASFMTVDVPGERALHIELPEGLVGTKRFIILPVTNSELAELRTVYEEFERYPQFQALTEMFVPMEENANLLEIVECLDLRANWSHLKEKN